MLLRSTGSLLPAGRDGQYLFDNIVTFALDRPPMGSNVISLVWIPYLRAARKWPNSCNSTQPNNSRMNPR